MKGSTFLLVFALVSCTPGPEESLAQNQPRTQEKKAVPETQFIDSARAARVPVVMRVRRIEEGAGSKYLWARVDVLRVLKNDGNHPFEKTLEVAYYSWEPGVPAGESTLYLEPYNDAPDHPWKLLDGSGTQGVSHADGKK